MKKYYYKVVTRNMNSYVTPFLTRSVVVKYELGAWVKPNIKGSKLFVFGNRREALSYSYSTATDRVFKCEVKEPKIGKRKSPLGYGLGKIGVKRFWGGTILNIDTTGTPRGTYYVSAVKLVEEIGDYINE